MGYLKKSNIGLISSQIAAELIDCLHLLLYLSLTGLECRRLLLELFLEGVVLDEDFIILVTLDVLELFD